MNSRLASLLSLACLVGLALSAPTETKFDVTISGNADQVGTSEPFEAVCDYSLSGFDDWAVVEVAFYKDDPEVNNGGQYPKIAEYKKDNTKQEKATFRTVGQTEGVKVQPEGGEQQQQFKSPMKVKVSPASGDNAEQQFAYVGQYKCSVTIQQKKEGGEKFRMVSDNYYIATPGRHA